MTPCRSSSTLKIMSCGWMTTCERVVSKRNLLRPFPASEMESYPVSISINSPRNQGVKLIERTAVNSA